MTLEPTTVRKMDKLIKIPRSRFVNILLKDIFFIIERIKENPGYYLMEKLFTDLYMFGLIDYSELVKTLGPQRAMEISQIIRTARKFKEWVKK